MWLIFRWINISSFFVLRDWWPKTWVVQKPKRDWPSKFWFVGFRGCWKTARLVGHIKVVVFLRMFGWRVFACLCCFAYLGLGWFQGLRENWSKRRCCIRESLSFQPAPQSGLGTSTTPSHGVFLSTHKFKEFPALMGFYGSFDEISPFIMWMIKTQ